MTKSIYTKFNQTGFADTLKREAQGLEWLRLHAKGCWIGIPEVISVDEKKLQLAKIPTKTWTETGWQRLGKGLAHIHRRSYSHVGFNQNNFIGLNPQPNGIWHNWGEFFVSNRLEYQISLITDTSIKNNFLQHVSLHKTQLITFLNEHIEQASLLHGDLWQGNVLCDEDSKPWLIDPATYIGDPEADIAMTQMFGGFASTFYSAYQAERPLSRQYQTKKIIYNLYHYLNHFNLFGEAYLDPCIEGIKDLAWL